jgi:hypothetical protein
MVRNANCRQKTKKRLRNKVPSGADAGLPIDGVVDRKNLMSEG